MFICDGVQYNIMIDLTQDLLKELFDYREDGNLIRRVTKAPNAKNGDVAGWISPNEYSQVSINNKLYLTHRVIFLYHHGYLPKEIDHVDRDPSNNQIENLREITKSQNQMNAKKHKDGCSSRFKGVNYNFQNKNWAAKITIDYKQKYLGSYKSETDAAIAYNDAAIELFGKYANLNVVD